MWLLRNNRGHTGSYFLLAVIIVLIGAIFLPRFFGLLPSWAKIAAIVAGAVILLAGYFIDRTSNWPRMPPGDNRDVPS